MALTEGDGFEDNEGSVNPSADTDAGAPVPRPLDEVIGGPGALSHVARDMRLLAALAKLFPDECTERSHDVGAVVARRDAGALETSAHSLSGSATTAAADALWGRRCNCKR